MASVYLCSYATSDSWEEFQSDSRMFFDGIEDLAAPNCQRVLGNEADIPGYLEAVAQGLRNWYKEMQDEDEEPKFPEKVIWHCRGWSERLGKVEKAGIYELLDGNPDVVAKTFGQDIKPWAIAVIHQMKVGL